MGGPRAKPIRALGDPAILGYLAGLVDGEGCIMAARSYGQRSASPCIAARVVIANTNLDLIEWLLETVGGTHTAKCRQDGWKPAYDWFLGGANARDFLRAIRPYLVIKGRQADAALRIADSMTSGSQRVGSDVIRIREAAYQELRLLNRRGSAPEEAA